MVVHSLGCENTLGLKDSLVAACVLARSLARALARVLAGLLGEAAALIAGAVGRLGLLGEAATGVARRHIYI